MNELEQQWPDSSSVYWELGKNNNANDIVVAANSLRNFAPSHRQTNKFATNNNKIIIEDNNPSSTYYISSPESRPLKGGYMNDEISQQQYGSGSSYNENYNYYPLINSASSEENTNSDTNTNQDEATIVNLNSKLLNIIDYPQFSHSRSSYPSYSSSSSDSNNNFDYDNNNYKLQYDKLLDELNQQDESIQNEERISSTDKLKDLYKLVGRKDDDNNRPRKLVTLLEDESNDKEEGGGINNNNNNRQKHSTEERATTSGPEDKTTTVSYGKVVTGKTNDVDGQQQSAGSVFNRMYKKLSNYLPFLSQINILKQGTTGKEEEEANKKNKQLTTKDNDKKTVADEKRKFSSLKNNDDHEMESKQPNTKQSVSTISLDSISNDDNSAINGDEYKATTSDADQADMIYNSKQAKTSPSLYSSTSSANENDINNKDNFDNNNKDNKKRLSARKKLNNSDKKLSDQDENEAEDNNNNGAKVSLLRQSSVVMPLKANDELVSEHTNNQVEANEQQQTSESSLIGRYIYSPTPTVSSTTKATTVKKLNNEQSMYHSKVLSHKAYSSRRQQAPEEGDFYEANDIEDDAYGRPMQTFAGSRPIGAYYTHHRVIDNPIGILQQNKTNDIYFLIMVGSFCAMAVAIVLAAGLFAYRVQQSRKSNNDTDYPTYGVVGPNNMMGGNGGAGGCGGAGLKCAGPGAIMGNYFNSNLNSATSGPNGLTGSIGNVGGILSNSSPMGSKLGSAKHLPDLYSLSDSGITTSSKSSSTRRISSTDNNNKDQSHKSNYITNQDAARMYHYQHQKQQMIISDRASAGRHTSASDLDSEDENDDGSYTVYECPGLASAHEMEIKNPLFNDDQTP